MKELNLPEPIAAYFKADTQDGRAVARCFISDGVVLDEGRTHSGQAAIEAWKSDASTCYTYTTQPRKLVRDGLSGVNYSGRSTTTRMAGR